MSEPIRCAALTPSGRGAVATIRICGPGCQEVVRRYFHTLKGLVRRGSLPLNRIVVGRWCSSTPATSSGSTPTNESVAGEEVVVARTAEETIDVHCHGGHAAVQAILVALEASGCQAVSGFDLFELPNAGKKSAEQSASKIRREAVVSLGKAATETVAGHLLAQYQGALLEEIDRCVAFLESGNVPKATGQLRRLRDPATLGLHLTKPFRVAFCGSPNVGKSSLVNALVGFERSIVFDQAGTTRDVLTVSTAIDGWPFELLDTAGLRQADTNTADGRIESAGIEMAIEHASEADLVVFVSAWDEPWTAELDHWLTQFPETLLIHNKSDLGTSRLDRPAGINSSLVPTAQVGSVLEAIGQRLISDAPPVGSPLLFTDRQVRLVDDSLTALGNNDVPAALVALRELR